MAGFNIDNLLRELRAEEGYRRTVYSDTLGVPTIGYGRNLRSRGVSEEEATYLLRNDVWEALMAAMELYAEVWHSLSRNRQEVLVKIAFQLGGGGLAKFAEFRKAVIAGNHVQASTELLDSLAATQTPARWRQHAEDWRVG